MSRQSAFREVMLKRMADLAVASLLLLLFSPVLILLSILIRLKLGRPVFFRQIRPGKGARPFTLIKFRTMLDQRTVSGKLLSDGERLTPFGQFLRSTSLDELPELYNVLKGEMSLVGPRPLLMEYLPLYSRVQARRHEVRPGITGWAQINGRNAIEWEKRLELDVWYVDNWSLALDFKILLKTVMLVFQRSGIQKEGYATMPYFKGVEKAGDEES